MPFYQTLKQIEFTVNNFKFPSNWDGWVSTLNGAELSASNTSQKVWLPLDFLKIGDEIVSYKIVGDMTEAAALTLDCKLVKINKADPVTTTDIAGGGITQVTGPSGNIDSESILSAVETVATDEQYTLEIDGTTGVGDSFILVGAEVKVNRK